LVRLDLPMHTAKEFGSANNQIFGPLGQTQSRHGQIKKKLKNCEEQFATKVMNFPKETKLAREELSSVKIVSMTGRVT